MLAFTNMNDILKHMQNVEMKLSVSTCHERKYKKRRLAHRKQDFFIRVIVW